jgi:hypothetical protein
MTTATLTPKQYRAQDTIHLGKEAIKIYEVTLRNEGFEFFTITESDAYKAAYIYRDQSVRVLFAKGVQRWMVVVNG